MIRSRSSSVKGSGLARSAWSLFRTTIHLAVGSSPCCNVAYETTIKMPGTGRHVGFYRVVAFDSPRE